MSYSLKENGIENVGMYAEYATMFNSLTNYKVYLYVFMASSLLFLYSNRTKENFNLEKFVEEHGYPIENHTVKTEDGYILTLHRIPYGANDSAVNKKSVIINHGLTSSAGDFLILGPGRSLGFLLADSGYDVWLMNSRGTSHSNKHVFMDEKNNKREFYNFSWHEIGLYDVPATIDYILKETNNTQLYYIGHSQGTTTFLVMNTMRPEYNEKIKFGVLMGPIIYLQNLGLMYRIISPYANLIFDVVNTLRVFDLSILETIQQILKSTCKYESFYSVCNIFYNFMGGYDDPEQTDMSEFPTILNTYPSNVAVKQIIHYVQLMANHKFCQFDYGSEKNLQVYGTPQPSDYKLELVSVPVAIYVGKNDRFSTVEDTKLAVSILKNVTDFKILPHKHWNHFDFGFAKDVVPMLYQDVIDTMSQH